MPDTGPDLYIDTVTLSNFAVCRRLDLLLTRYGRRMCITPEVLDEITDGIVSGYPALTEVETAVTEGRFRDAGAMTTAERQIYRELLRTLAAGEASCIACAAARGGRVVTDDRAARACCTERHVQFTGTIGILKACCRDGALSPQEADDILHDMVAAGYHSPVRRISALIS
jgi:predicted nucleic acid-binding protein